MPAVGEGDGEPPSCRACQPPPRARPLEAPEAPPEPELAALGRADGVELAVALAVGFLPGEGRTLFAMEPVPAGRRLLLERPAAVACSRAELEARAAELLGEDDGALAPAWPAGAPVEPSWATQEVVTSFSFDFLDGACVALFRVIGVLNHACAPSEEANCCLSAPFDAAAVAEDEAVALVAVRDVPRGAPLRMSYICPFAPASRLHALQREHRFVCRCSACRAGVWAGAPAGQSLVRCCAACGAGGADGPGAGVALRLCGGCKAVLYCGPACQREHRSQHRPHCREGAGDAAGEAFRAAVEREFDAVMAASDAALGAASQALEARRRFAGEAPLEESLGAARDFLARRTAGGDAGGAGGAAGGASCAEALQARRRFAGEGPLEESLGAARGFLARRAAGGAAGGAGGAAGGAGDAEGGTAGGAGVAGWLLARDHPFVYYVRGNIVKQALTRLAQRFRLRGREPAGGGCGALAVWACEQLEGCLNCAAATLPRFHVEVLSLLRDAADLGSLTTDLRGLAADLAAWGEDDEGRVEEAGLEAVAAWCLAACARFRDVLTAYGEGPARNAWE